MSEETKNELIRLLTSGNSIPDEYKEILFPTVNKEYELSYFGKMESEDTVTLPYTYFGLGTLTNERDSYTEEDGKRHSTLLYDIVLDDEVPEDYYIDFEIPNSVQ